MRFASVAIAFLVSCAGIGLAASDHADHLRRHVTKHSHMSPAEAVVESQVKAYNKGDVDKFVAAYAPSVEFYDLGNPVAWLVGQDQLREAYGPVFAAYPKLKVTITNRIVEGDYVVDHESVTGMGDPAPVTALAIYEVKNGQITRVWFNPLQ
jgi:hypothetical protein